MACENDALPGIAGKDGERSSVHGFEYGAANVVASKTGRRWGWARGWGSAKKADRRLTMLVIMTLVFPTRVRHDEG